MEGGRRGSHVTGPAATLEEWWEWSGDKESTHDGVIATRTGVREKDTEMVGRLWGIKVHALHVGKMRK